MRALVRALDWSQTPLGPTAAWPQSLKTAASIALESSFPMYIAWGPRFIQIYNDAYRPILGSTKHPGALGSSSAETFAESWHIIAPMFEEVRRGRTVGSTDWMLPLDRHGYLEECYFIFSYSPIRDESGDVGGVLVTVTESTNRVLADRRLRALRDLAMVASEACTIEGVCTSAIEVLRGNRADLLFALIYLLDRDGTKATLAGASGVEAGSAGCPSVIELGKLEGGRPEGAWPLVVVARERRPLLLDARQALVIGPLHGAPWPEPPRAVLLLPITRSAQGQLHGVLVVGVSPRLALDDDYRGFLELVAHHLGRALSNALALAEERSRQAALEQLDRAKTAFFSNVSHEFRTPLTLMLGPIEDALGSSGASLSGDELARVHRNCRRLLKLVNSLLDFSRVEAGRSVICFEPTDLARLSAELASVFRSAIEKAGLHLLVDCEPLPDPVYVDRHMWEMVVLNLVSNAFKHTFTGSIRVTLRASVDQVTLTIADTGVGIAPEDLVQLFQRFHRISTKQARTHEGSGIGLALVQEIVRMHGGATTVTSELGVGTSVSVTLPRGHAHLQGDRIRSHGSPEPPSTSSLASLYSDEAMQWLGNEASRAAPTGEEPGRATGPRILLVDDNADMREYLVRLLTGEGFLVDSVADGAAALVAARTRTPALVLADVMMPELDGFELLAVLQAEPTTREIPVVFLSARAGEQARIEGLQAGVVDYLIKPFSARELIARIRALVEHARARAQVQAHREELVEAARRKDEFLAMLAHELRNPLAAVRSALELMAHGAKDPDRLVSLQEVCLRQVHSLGRLVDDLLDVSRITRNKVDLRIETVELRALVRDVLASVQPLIDAQGHSLRLELGVKPLWAQLDPTRIEQVIGNLLSNAIKYTLPGGRIAVLLERERRDEQDWAVLRVEDNGKGIAPGELQRVFEPFVQFDVDLDRSTGGLGIGLTLVERLVEMHGGSVVARSEGLGRGTQMIVRLPLCERADERRARSDDPEALRRGPVVTRRVLLIEDNPDIRGLVHEYLESLGHEVTVASDGERGVAALLELRPDVALVDLGLPGIDGYAIARRLRANPLGHRTFLVALSGYGGEDVRADVLAAGFDLHLVKPVGFQELDAAIETSGVRG